MEFSGFLIGPERSGTTLTSAYLSNHPEVYVINDPHYLNFFAGLLIQYCQEKKSDEIIRSINSSSLAKDYKPILNMGLKTVADWYERWNEFKGDDTDIEKFYELHNFLVNDRDISLRSYFHYFHLSLIPREIRREKKKYVVKIPDLARFSFILNNLYHDKAVVYNIRHPVCNIASIINPNKDRGWTFDQIIEWYKSFFPSDLENRFKNALFNRYEDLLLLNPKESWKRIFKKYNLSTHDIWDSNSFSYPNKKVMYKTKGKVNVKRLTSSLSEMTPLQMLQAMENTKHIQEKFYSDIPLMKLINEVNLKVKQGE